MAGVDNFLCLSAFGNIILQTVDGRTDGWTAMCVSVRPACVAVALMLLPLVLM